MNENEYIFKRKYTTKYIVIKLTDKYVELHLDYDTKAMKLLWEEIDFIRLYAITAGSTPLISEIKIKTKNKKFYKIPTDSIENIEFLFKILNGKYKNKTNIDLSYRKYLDYLEREKLYYGFLAIMIGLIGFIYLWNSILVPRFGFEYIH